MKWRFILVVFFVIAFVYACSSADTSPAIILNQWNVNSFATKDSSGHVQRHNASGFFVLRSDFGYTENVTIDGTSHIQLGTYASTEDRCDAGSGADAGTCPNAGTITLIVTGVTPVSYNYFLSTDDGGGPDGGLGGTMTWTSGALPDGGTFDAGPSAQTEEWSFTLHSYSVLSQ